MQNKQAHAGDEQYDSNFFNYMKTDSYRYGAGVIQILSHVAKYIHPRTVLDVGCAIGTWLEFWQKNFGAEVYGIDGDYVDRSQLLIAEENFQAINLENRIIADSRFDLVETLEVAEHLSPARADSFVEDLTHLSDVILFSAAIPAQGGTNHVNEQWQSYWSEKFLRYGYVAVDCIRPVIWEDSRIDPHRKQNPFIYIKSSELYRYPELQEFYLKHRDKTILDMVHPQLWIIKLQELQNAYDQLANAYIHLQKQLAADKPGKEELSI